MSETYRKSREFTYGGHRGYNTAYRATTGAPLASQGYTAPIEAYGTQTTWSRDTLFPRRRHLMARARARGQVSFLERQKLDFGSSFTTTSQKYSDNGCLNRIITTGRINSVGTIYQYSGPLMGKNPGARNVAFQLYPAISDVDLYQEMLQAGPTAIAATIPTNPSVGVGALIGESMERLPKLPGAALLGRPGNVSKKFADEYLNYEFGLKPLISDVKGIAETVKNTNRILDQLQRDSGRLVRRRYEFPTEHTLVKISEGESQVTHPPIATVLTTVNGKRTHHRETVKRMWFSGAYTYHYETGSNLASRLKRTEQQFNKLFGLRLTPSLLWELTPWSWAADWVTNAGDVMENLSAFSQDGLVMAWGYIMCDYTITDIYTADIPYYGGVTHTEQRFSTNIKKRIRASPYGFGLDPDWWDLSSRQLAILGALGITRGR